MENADPEMETDDVISRLEEIDRLYGIPDQDGEFWTPLCVCGGDNRSIQYPPLPPFPFVSDPENYFVIAFCITRAWGREGEREGKAWGREKLAPSRKMGAPGVLFI